MAWNCLAEHRISAERFQTFLRHLASKPISSDVLQSAFNAYQKTDVRVSSSVGSQPAYELAENANNYVTLTHGTDLCTMVDLTRIGYVYAFARELGFPEFARFERADPSAVNDFLESLRDPGLRETILDAIFKALARYRAEESPKIHPTWAAAWTSIESCLNPKIPRRWIEAVGVTKDEPIWVAVVRYPAPAQLFRPTLLDAGWYAHHFPSPPIAEVQVGGITMDLHSEDLTLNGLVSEYIHRQIDFTLDHWKAAGGLVDLTDGPIPKADQTLSALRKRHLDRLLRRYPSTGPWPNFSLKNITQKV